MQHITNTIQWRAIGLLALLAAGICSCAGRAIHDDDMALSTGGYSLRVLEESFIDSGSADFSVQEASLPDGALELSLTARNAQGLKALYVELSYDEDRFSVPDTAAGSLLGQTAGCLSLQLSAAPEAGRLLHGEVLAAYETERGLYGSATLLRLQLRPAGRQAPGGGVRNATAAAETSFAEQLRFDPATRSVSFSYGAQGDYDQNGVVGISDLTPLGQHFGGQQQGGFDYDSAIGVVDGDRNGEVGISDITPIGANFGAVIEGFRLYGAEQHLAEELYPADGSPSGTDALGWLPLSASEETLAGSMRRRYVLDTSLQPYGMVYWLRPLISGMEGHPSNRSDRGWAGASAAQVELSSQGSEGSAPLQLFINASASSDSDGDIIGYAFVRSDAPAAMFGDSPAYNELLSLPANVRYYVYVMDDDGICAMSPALHVSATLAGDHAPQLVAKFPEGLSGPAGFDLKVDMSESSDVDGDPISYSMLIHAYGGDGIALLSAEGPEPLMEYSFSEPGNYQLRVSVEQQNGLEDHRYYTVRVLDGGNALPIAGFHQDKTTLNSGAAISFSLSAESLDSDGQIVKYEIDPQGSHEWIEFDLARHDFIYAYPEAGYYRPRLRVTDNDGALAYSSPGYVEVLGSPGTAPSPLLELSPPAGAAPLSVRIGGSSSFDANGIIVDYAFDIGDGNGFVSNGDNPHIEHVFPLGTHQVRLRVTDNQGLSSIVEGQVHALLPL